jgi:hypothetical protein
VSGGEFGAKFAKSVFGTGDEEEVVFIRGEAACEGLADAAGGSGDEGGGHISSHSSAGRTNE